MRELKTFCNLSDKVLFPFFIAVTTLASSFLSANTMLTCCFIPPVMFTQTGLLFRISSDGVKWMNRSGSGLCLNFTQARDNHCSLWSDARVVTKQSTADRLLGLCSNSRWFSFYRSNCARLIDVVRCSLAARYWEHFTKLLDPLHTADANPGVQWSGHLYPRRSHAGSSPAYIISGIFDAFNRPNIWHNEWKVTITELGQINVGKR